MLKILANDGIDASGKEALEALGHQVDINHYEGEELIEQLKDSDVIVIRSATKLRADLFEKVKGSRLKLAIRAGVGMDNIDIPEGEAAGVAVRNTPNSSSASVAELALGHMFAVSRFLVASNVTMRDGQWNKKAYKGVELAGKTLGLVGFGRISRSLADKASALGMKVIYTDIIGEAKDCSNYKFDTLEGVLKNADYVSLHIPFFKEKGATINKKELDMMKDGSYIINCARGGVVNEADLLDALNSGKIAGAGVDVFEEEPTKNTDLINHPNVSVTPHIGGSTNEAQRRIGEETVEVIKNFKF